MRNRLGSSLRFLISVNEYKFCPYSGPSERSSPKVLYSTNSPVKLFVLLFANTCSSILISAMCKLVVKFKPILISAMCKLVVKFKLTFSRQVHNVGLFSLLLKVYLISVSDHRGLLWQYSCEQKTLFLHFNILPTLNCCITKSVDIFCEYYLLFLSLTRGVMRSI